MPTLAARAEAALLRADLHEYVRRAWAVIDPAPFIDGWHVGAICEHLAAVSTLEIRNLAITLPPGFSKSRICSVLWPTWHWTRPEQLTDIAPGDDPEHGRPVVCGPGTYWMYASVDQGLAKRDSLACKVLMNSTWYRERFPDVVVDRTGERAEHVKEWYCRYREPDGEDAGAWRPGGLRWTTSIGAGAVGWHVDIQVCDDPFKPLTVCDAEAARVRNWWKGTMSTRKRSAATFRRLTVQQRLHARDLIDWAREQGHDVLDLPMEYDPRRYSLPPEDPRAIHPTSIAPRGQDPRTEPGELLCPARTSAEQLPAVKKDAGGWYEIQYNTDVRTATHRVFSRAKFRRRWKSLPSGGIYSWAWDLRNNKTGLGGSWVVGWLFCALGPDTYVVDERRGQWGPEDSKHEILAGVRRQPGEVLIERAASGDAVADALDLDVPGLVLVPARGGKERRAEAVEEFCPRVWFPADAPWVPDALDELDRFPAEPNDRGDVLSHYLARRYLDKGTSYQDYLAKLGRGSRRTA